MNKTDHVFCSHGQRPSYRELERHVDVDRLLFAQSSKVVPAAGCCHSITEKGYSRSYQIFSLKTWRVRPRMSWLQYWTARFRVMISSRSKMKKPNEMEIPAESANSRSTRMRHSTLRQESEIRTTLAPSSAWSLLKIVSHSSKKKP